MKRTFLHSRSIFLINAILVLFFTIPACGQSKSKPTKENAESHNSSKQENEEKKSEACDFSEYNTLKETPKSLISLVRPIYPKSAQRKKITGKVQIRVLVNRAGKVEKACAVKGHKLLTASALNAIRRWSYPAETTQKELDLTKKGFYEFVVAFDFSPDGIK